MPVKFHQEVVSDPALAATFAVDVRSVHRSTYDKLVLNFGANYCFRTAGSPIEVLHNTFRFQTLQALVPSDGGQYALVVYHGLEGNNIVFGFRVVKMLSAATPGTFTLDPVLNTPPGQVPTHVLDNGQFEPVATHRIPWADLRDAYWRDVRVDRIGNGDYKPLSPVHDPKSITFPWDAELKHLWIDNLAVINGRASWVQVDSASSFHLVGAGINGPQGFRHGIGMHMLVEDNGSFRPLMNDLDTGILYENKGADFGNLCPPTCNSYIQP
jgi:hypothetical protein